MADGTLSDTYAPTIDNTDVKSLDPIVTGPGFTALQPRDMTYRVSALDGTGMACEVTATDAAHHFELVTDYITDPAAEAVVMRISLVPLPGAPAGLSVYLRFNPLLNGHGGGGSGNAGGESATIVSTARGPVPLSYSTNSFTEAVNRSYATPIYAALAASTPFQAVETGYAGASSDGLTELDSSGSLTSTAPDASNGNVVQTVKLGLGTREGGQHGDRGPRVRRHRERRAAHRPDRVGRSVRGHVRRLPGRLAGLRRPAAAAGRRRAPPRHAAVRRAGQRLLAERQRAEGQRGQDVPRRDRRLPVQPVGAGGGRRPAGRRAGPVLRLLPGGVPARHLRGVHRVPDRR